MLPDSALWNGIDVVDLLEIVVLHQGERRQSEVCMEDINLVAWSV